MANLLERIVAGSLRMADDFEALAKRAVMACREIAVISDVPGETTRTFLSPATHHVHDYLRAWMGELGMAVTVDAVGNVRGVYGSGPRFILGSHIDTVPNAGAFDGVLGVVIALCLVESLEGESLPFSIEVVAFSEEEGVRFSAPCLGSGALIGDLGEEVLEFKDSDGITVRESIRDFGLDPAGIPDAEIKEALGYLEFHIEQGPILESLNLPLGIVTAISGQLRLHMTFKGEARHAGTTPMNARRDALAGAAEWISQVERSARDVPGAVATVGWIKALPGAGNVIPGEVKLSLDVRHQDDQVRSRLWLELIEGAKDICDERSLLIRVVESTNQKTVPMDPAMQEDLESAFFACGIPVHRLPSGAGHDAMIIAKKFPAAMIFLRSPGGISHHPDESVRTEDVAAALRVGREFLLSLGP